MTVEENKSIARGYFEEIWNKQNLPAVDQWFAAAFVGHVQDTTVRGSEALKQRIATGFADEMHFTIKDVVAEGDKVCVHWIYLAKSENKQERIAGMHLFRFAGGKIEEFWVYLIPRTCSNKMEGGCCCGCRFRIKTNTISQS